MLEISIERQKCAIIIFLFKFWQVHLVTPVHVLMVAIVLLQEQPTHVNVSMDSQGLIVRQVSYNWNYIIIFFKPR